MVNENLIPKFEEIREIKYEIPSYEEFMKTYQIDKEVENSYWDEIIAKSEIPSYGPGEEWKRLIIACPAKDCPSMDSGEVSRWIHRRSQCRSSYEQYLEWSTEANVKCNYCDNPSHIMNWSFKCHNHSEYHRMDGMKFTRAIISAINYGSIDSNFSTKLLKYFEKNPF